MLSTKLQKIRELALTKEGDCFKKCPYKDSECLETCLQVLQKLILEIIDNESENIIGDITENNTIEKSGMSQKK